jgi:uncharacterized protein (TIGR02677 family)
LADERDTNLIKPIIELNYLNVSNVGRYRCIMRYFYEQHQKLRYWLRPEEVYDGVVGYGLLEEYSPEQCQKDLEQLAEWRNLIPRHDGGRANTIEEYLRKKFRFQLTPYSVEIERLLEGLEKIRGYGGSLEPTLLETIFNGLQKLLIKGGTYQEGEAAQLWKSIYDNFRQLTEDAADYIASLQSAKAEELMMTEAFLVFKAALTLHLQNFVKGLQIHGVKIEGLLPRITPDIRGAFLKQVLDDLARTPRLDEAPSPEEERQQLEREWESLLRWFVGDSRDSSDVQFLEQATKDTIAKVVRCALRIQEKQRSGVSRRRELEYLGRWFFGLSSQEEAHELAAYAFGLYKTRHFQGIDNKGTDSAEVSMWDVGPNIRALYSKSRSRRRDGGTQPMQSRRKDQEQAQEVYLARQREEEEVLQSFVRQGRITMSDLGAIPAVLRHRLLQWIGLCMGNKTRSIRTPDGVVIKLIMPRGGERTVLGCEDGELEMPDYTLIFEDTLLNKQLAK